MPDERYLIKTDHGDVVVTVDADADGLDPDLLAFEPADAAATRGIDLEIPLRAFAAKMISIVERKTSATPGGERMRAMLIQEKATSDLRRIERWARDHAA